MNWKNKKNLKHLYIILLIMFILYLICANRIVTQVFAIPNIKKDDLSNYETQSEVIYEFDQMYKDQTLGVFHMGGYAFCSNDKPNPDREVIILFHSEKETYSVKCTTDKERKGAVVKHGKSGKLFYDNQVGIECEFSLLNMPDDKYDVYSYVWENEEAYGLIKTSYCYEKKDKEITRAF